jgi:hypothetical protein
MRQVIVVEAVTSIIEVCLVAGKEFRMWSLGMMMVKRFQEKKNCNRSPPTRRKSSRNNSDVIS